MRRALPAPVEQLSTGGFLNMLIKNSAIVPISDMTGIMEFAGIWKKRSQVYATPAYYVFKLYANADIVEEVAVTTAQVRTQFPMGSIGCRRLLLSRISTWWPPLVKMAETLTLVLRESQPYHRHSYKNQPP